MNKKNETVKKYKNLISTLKKHNHYYYNEDNPIITDSEYDNLKKKIFTLEQKNLNGLLSPVTRRDWPLIKDKMANFILETIEQQLSQLSCLKFLPTIVAKSGKVFLDYGSYDGITPSDMFMLKNGNAKKIYFRLESLDEHQTEIQIVSKVESLADLVGQKVEVVSGS